MVRRGRDEIGKVGGASGEVSLRMTPSTPPPPPPPCATNAKGAVDLDDEDAAVGAFDAALVRAVRFVRWRHLCDMAYDIESSAGLARSSLKATHSVPDDREIQVPVQSRDTTAVRSIVDLATLDRARIGTKRRTRY